MDSLLYLGAGDEEESESESAAEEEQEEQVDAKPAADPAFDYAALQRAGYKEATDLRQTETYQKLRMAEEDEREEKRKASEQEAEEEVAAKAAREAEKEALLNQKKADEKNGWEKRYDRTKEDFRAKEKRKRSMGQQSSTGDWVQEEKRRLRHGETGNYDS